MRGASRGGRGLGEIAARAAYLVVLAAATLHPFGFHAVASPLAALAGAMDPSLGARDLVDAARNLVLFAGWGAVWTVTSVSAARGRGPARRGRGTGVGAAVGAVVTGFLASGGLEVVQVWSVVRDPSVLDVASNTLGAGAGAAATAWLLSALQAGRRRPSFLGVPAWLPAGSYGLAVVLEAAFPLLRHGPPLSWGGPARRFRAALEALDPGSLLVLPFLDLLLFALAGALAVLALVEADPEPLRTGAGLRGDAGRAAAAVSAAGAGVAVAGELAHAVLGQPLLLGPVAVHAAGVAAGAWAAGRWGPDAIRRLRGPDRARVLLAAWSAAVLAWLWRPFAPVAGLDPAEVFSAARWVPLWALGGRVDLYSVGDVAVSFFLFFPVGALLAAWPLRSRGWLGGPWPAVWLAAAGEGGQVLVAGRFFDVTDLLVCVGGALLGWAALRRAGWRGGGRRGTA